MDAFASPTVRLIWVSSDLRRCRAEDGETVADSPPSVL